MGKVELLDCTLRDGAYIVDSRFGVGPIKGIISSLIAGNVDVVECGWLKDKEHELGTSFFHIPADIEQYLPVYKRETTLVAMIDWNRYDDSALPERDGKSIDAVRVVFPRGKAVEGMQIAGRIKKKNYRVFLQAANTLSYSEDELIELAKLSNKCMPEGISIVDTFGAMYEDDLIHIAKILDSTLDKNIKLGFHSHNNQQMAFANTITFVNYFADLDRDIIVDSSLCGMGRGAGNATTELVANFLNRKYHKNYDMNQVLDAIDTYMKGFELNYKWGYSIPYFIAGINCCHVNNIAYLIDHHNTSAKDMRNIIESLSAEERLKYDYDLLESKYVENQNRVVDDLSNLNVLKDAMRNKSVVLVAPGISSKLCSDKVQKAITDNNSIAIAVNAFVEGYSYNYFFVTNKVRYEYAKNAYSDTFNKTRRIVLSNIKSDAVSEDCIINYNRVVKRGWEHFDNAVICCLRMLCILDVKKVMLAGFDGFGQHYNESYADASLPTYGENIDYSGLNIEIRDMYQDFKMTCSDKMEIEFLTDSIFE